LADQKEEEWDDLLKMLAENAGKTAVRSTESDATQIKKIWTATNEWLIRFAD
jgi:hypothetical protein